MLKQIQKQFAHVPNKLCILPSRYYQLIIFNVYTNGAAVGSRIKRSLIQLFDFGVISTKKVLPESFIVELFYDFGAYEYY